MVHVGDSLSRRVQRSSRRLRRDALLAQAGSHAASPLPRVAVTGERADLAIQIRSALVAIWNARGAVDIAKLEAELRSMMGANVSGLYVNRLDLALRRLDR